MKPLSAEEVLELVPQQPPMRFLSEILELDEEHALTAYTWTEQDCAGHFPGDLVVPGVKIIECAAQAGLVAWAIYHLSRTLSAEEVRQLVGFFSEVENGRFKAVVRPGDSVTAAASFGEEGFFREDKISVEAVVRFRGGGKDGEDVFHGSLTGVWRPRYEMREEDPTR